MTATTTTASTVVIRDEHALPILVVSAPVTGPPARLTSSPSVKEDRRHGYP
jgi:hypothetical protein